MVNKPATFLGVAIALLCGCVSVDNRNGLRPPSALCSHIKGTVSVPREPVLVGGLKTGHTDVAVHLKEWVFTGASAGLVDMALAKAVENGELRKVHYADYEQTSILGFVTVFNLTAYGE